MKKALLALLFLGLVVWLFFQEIRNAALSGLIVADVLRYGRPPLLRYVTPEPKVMLVRYGGGGREMEADFYLPRDGRAHPGLILVHGVNEVGKADPRIKWAAEVFCRAGFCVLVPDFLGFKSQRLRPSDIQEIADSLLYLSSRQDLVRPDRLGIAGFSYGAGPTLIAACDPRIRKKVDFLVSFGGYYDLTNIIEFVTTGHYSYHGKSFHRPPNDYTRWIFLHYNLDLLNQEEDRRLLREAEAWKDRGQEEELRRRLSEEGKAVYDLLNNRDPKEVPRLLSRLPAKLHGYIEDLSPSRYIHDLKAYLFIVHGVPDDFIPHTESLRLAEALPHKDRARLALLRIFSHVRPSLPRPTPSSILFVYLPEGAKFYSLVHGLLKRAS
jgi:dienelactone hydrolase